MLNMQADDNGSNVLCKTSLSVSTFDIFVSKNEHDQKFYQSFKSYLADLDNVQRNPPVTVSSLFYFTVTIFFLLVESVVCTD